MPGESFTPSPAVQAYRAVTALAPVILTGAGALGAKVFNPHPEDAGRLQDNQDAYNAGVNGQLYMGWDPVTFLGVRGNVLPSPDGKTFAWATGTATDDARAKYYALSSGTGITAAAAVNASSGDVFTKASAFFNNLTKGPSTAVGTAAGNAAATKVQSTILLAALIIGLAVAIGLNLRKH